MRPGAFAGGLFGQDAFEHPGAGSGLRPAEMVELAIGCVGHAGGLEIDARKEHSDAALEFGRAGSGAGHRLRPGRGRGSLGPRARRPGDKLPCLSGSRSRTRADSRSPKAWSPADAGLVEDQAEWRRRSCCARRCGWDAPVGQPGADARRGGTTSSRGARAADQRCAWGSSPHSRKLGVEFEQPGETVGALERSTSFGERSSLPARYQQ